MLTDRFGRAIEYLRISVTDRCNLRCSYCIPRGYKNFVVTDNWLTFDEIERVVATFSRLGASHYRLTGGEPLLRKNLSKLISKLSILSGVKDISITTNGTQLANQAEDLYKAGVRRINVSLDSLRQECIQKITGSDCLNKVLAGLEVAKSVGFEKIKINMVPLINQNIDDIEQMVSFCIKNQFVLCLIEVMPLGVSGQKVKYVDLQFVISLLKSKFNLIPSTKIIGNGPARYWQTIDGYFILGLITPMSQHFCATCNRVRLSVNGVLYLCLGQNYSVDLRPLLRKGCSDMELEETIKEAIRLKPEAHNFREEPTKIIRLMSMTGG